MIDWLRPSFVDEDQSLLPRQPHRNAGPKAACTSRWLGSGLEKPKVWKLPFLLLFKYKSYTSLFHSTTKFTSIRWTEFRPQLTTYRVFWKDLCRDVPTNPSISNRTNVSRSAPHLYLLLRQAGQVFQHLSQWMKSHGEKHCPCLKLVTFWGHFCLEVAFSCLLYIPKPSSGRSFNSEFP
jgi:hypothetical protein